jgi:hypothetical protein
MTWAKFKQILKDLWLRLDGNKTLIGTAILGILQAFPLAQPYQAIAMALVGLLTGVSAVHRYKKGYFGTEKGH